MRKTQKSIFICIHDSIIQLAANLDQSAVKSGFTLSPFLPLKAIIWQRIGTGFQIFLFRNSDKNYSSPFFLGDNALPHLLLFEFVVAAGAALRRLLQNKNHWTSATRYLVIFWSILWTKTPNLAFLKIKGALLYNAVPFVCRIIMTRDYFEKKNSLSNLSSFIAIIRSVYNCIFLLFKNITVHCLFESN